MQPLRAFLLILSVSAPLAACSSNASEPARPVPEDLDRRLTDAECAASVDHATQVLAADPNGETFAAQMREHRDDHIAECLGIATLRDHRCMMAATTMTAMGECPLPGTAPPANQ